MYYCEHCRLRNDWPEDVDTLSHGHCEMCAEYHPCHDVPASILTPARSLKTLSIMNESRAERRHGTEAVMADKDH